jgi:quercetin dioxygenase-like cupin family protein
MDIEKGYWCVAKRNRQEAFVPHAFEKHSKGYQRFTLVGRSVGSVHQEIGICELQPNGSVDFCLHAFEEGIYVLDGEVELLRGREAFRLAADDYALVPYGVSHAYRNSGDKVARWFEVLAPQPKLPGGWQDTYFFDVDWPKDVIKPDFADPRTRLLGHFKGQNARIVSTPDIHGLTVYQFINEEFGAQHFYLMRGEFEVGATYGRSDHPVEESFYALSGEIEMEIEGKTFHLQPGDAAWVGVGTIHAWKNSGNVPYRWIETQAPQFPIQHKTRRHSHWDRLRSLQKG